MALILDTERLRLRELEADDLDHLMRILGDARAMEFWPSVMSRAEGREWIANQQERYARDGCGYWACELRESGEFIGQAGLLQQAVDGTAELGLGYMFIPDSWGKGYATEAARGCIEYGFKHYSDDHIVALIRPINAPSIRVAGRLGMSRWKTVEYKGYEHGVWKRERMKDEG